MFYELATLTHAFGAAPKILAGVAARAQKPGAGALIGCWTAEIGALNQIFVLRGFVDFAELLAERGALLSDLDPFEGGPGLLALDFESFQAFPWLPAPTPGAYGSVYEIRTYRLKKGGVAPTIAAWEAAMVERQKYSPLVLAMVALDGPPRFTHIWPYRDLAHRTEARSRSVADGAWPPKGGPDWLTGDMRSIIALPAAISPLA